MFSKKKKRTLFLQSKANNSNLWDDSQTLSTMPRQRKEQKFKPGPDFPRGQPQLSSRSHEYAGLCHDKPTGAVLGTVWPHRAFCSWSQMQILKSRDPIKPMHPNQFRNRALNNLKNLRTQFSFKMMLE